MAKEYFENYVLSEEIPYINKFDDERLGLKQELLNGIYGSGYDRPSPIQRIGIKPIVDGRDLVLQSHSGTGKTCTFLSGTIQRLDFDVKKTQAVILSNTKELTDQIRDNFVDLSKYTGLTYRVCIGGDGGHGNRYQEGAFTEQVIIGTPGRVCDMMMKGFIHAPDVKILVIDEADEVLSVGFRKQVKGIISCLSQQCQIVLSSATIPAEMKAIVDNILRKDHVEILVKDEELTLEEISQYYVALDEYTKTEILFDIYQHMSIGQCIIYCNKKYRADELKHHFDQANYSAGILHGDMMHSERKNVMSEFRKGHLRVLITTDVMARGIDVQQVSLVINYDMPKYTQTYIHRIGRSGRFGRTGVAINFVTKKEKNMIHFIEKTFETVIKPLPQDLRQII